MKFIVGYFTAKPGKRDAFLAAAQEHIRMTRLEPDCRYFELVPVPDHPDRLLLAEAFASEEAHRLHEQSDHMRGLANVMPDLLSHVTIDSIVTDDVRHIEERFD